MQIIVIEKSLSQAAEAEGLLGQAQDDIASLEEELATIKGENFQLRSVKDLEEQMIKYQKELQEQLRDSEQREEGLRAAVDSAREAADRLEAELSSARTQHEEEVARLNLDSQDRDTSDDAMAPEMSNDKEKTSGGKAAKLSPRQRQRRQSLARFKRKKLGEEWIV